MSARASRVRTAVLASGRGSNLQALLAAAADPDYPASIALVVSDRPDAQALARARERSVPTVVVERARFADRSAFEAALVAALESAAIEVLCLAGFMRILGPAVVGRWAGRILNIHPSLLPSFPGLDAQAQALAAGVKVTGATVHLVDEGIDTGPIVLQTAVPVLEGDTVASLAARILVEEHRVYPTALRLLAEGRLRVEGRRVVVVPSAGPLAPDEAVSSATSRGWPPMNVRRALVSVHDKRGVVDFARGLTRLGVEILSTGGTARLLRAAGLSVREVADVTGFPEMLDGRVKTLHPKVHGGILARRDVPADLATLEHHGIPPIDLVAVALYPFEEAAAKDGAPPGDVIEEIDVGGPAMIRAAAKNHASVAVVTGPEQYAGVLAELEAGGGNLSAGTRARLAAAAFARTAGYDRAIAGWLARQASPAGADGGAACEVAEPTDREVAEPTDWPARQVLELERVLPLRYGENPHQRAAFYRIVGGPAVGFGALEQLQGPELGYNNLLDLSAALGLLGEFAEPAAVVVKHTNPCGAATGPSAADAATRARASDPVSIFGGIVAVNREADEAVVAALAGVFLEVLCAPGFSPGALDELARTKKRCRVLRLAAAPAARSSAASWVAEGLEFRSVAGGLLAQSADSLDVDEARLTVVSRRAPDPDELAELRFAWRVAKHVKSNAIVLTRAGQVLGVGAGQMNRVDAARLAVSRAREAGFDTLGSVCASDAFFPFRDGLDVVAGAGATAVIQPGGSVRDPEILAAADEHGLAMVLTGIRHFRH